MKDRQFEHQTGKGNFLSIKLLVRKEFEHACMHLFYFVLGER